mmetsp:Transcript_3897/g.9907  ORF Transcript_3897/g.9907 Transcript_3897/m.9907 type:complete len:84 (+) Transcript_3897:275-526(+)
MLDSFERGMVTRKRNAEVDHTITELLSLIMSATYEIPSQDDNPILSSYLSIVEYLIRQFLVHSRPTTARTLLLLDGDDISMAK